MDETESCLEWLIHQVGEVVLDLLSSLNVDKFQDNRCKEVDILVLYFFVVSHFLNFQTHVSADATYFLVFPHILIHLQQSFSLRS